MWVDGVKPSAVRPRSFRPRSKLSVQCHWTWRPISRGLLSVMTDHPLVPADDTTSKVGDRSARLWTSGSPFFVEFRMPFERSEDGAVDKETMS